MKITKKDRELLALLQKDCRKSNAELAQEIGMSASACWRRVKTFEEAGIIQRYGAILQSDKLGLAFQAIVHVQLVRHNFDADAVAEFIKSVSAREEVQACYATTGQADYHLIVLCEDINTYNEFLEDFLFRLSAVKSAQTNVVLKQLKELSTM
jgi:DNA-binding Lrp family transcriptional regulator